MFQLPHKPVPVVGDEGLEEAGLDLLASTRLLADQKGGEDALEGEHASAEAGDGKGPELWALAVKLLAENVKAAGVGGNYGVVAFDVFEALSSGPKPETAQWTRAGLTSVRVS